MECSAPHPFHTLQYDVINDSSEVFADSKSFETIFLTWVLLNEKKTDAMIDKVINMLCHQTRLKPKKLAKKGRNIF